MKLANTTAAMLVAIIIVTVLVISGPSSTQAASNGQPIKIMAWNIQILGDTKMSNTEIVDIIVRTMITQDMIFVQEIRDSEMTTATALLNKLNGVAGPDVFALVESERLGRTSSKEQYAIYYRQSRLKFNSYYIYDDTIDIFEREPMVAYFTVIGGVYLREFFVIGIHASPESARVEVDKLADVYADAIARVPDITDSIIMGDFNADCDYICASCFDALRLWTESERYDWVIPHTFDTTTRVSTDCAYDRFVLTGDSMKEQFVAPAAIYDFQTEYNLNKTFTEDVSDHYPIVMTVRDVCTAALYITAWHIPTFGNKRMDDEAIVDIIVKVMAQSDIIFIQGIQDSEEKLHTNLLDSLNTYYEGTSGISNAYSVVASQRLGTSTLEQYAYYYRNDKVKLVHHYLYNDAGNDYPYDPMVAYFSPINGIGLHGDMQDFFIIGARTRASSATRSMTDKLVDVHADALTKFPLVTNGIILGDLFADCSYICASCFDAIRLWTDEQYTWIIDADTTTTASDCAFDRLVVTGNQMKTQTIAAVVDFKMMYNLNDSMARSVSTHFPVTMPICESNQV